MPVSTLKMRVHKYIPDRLYGFVVDDRGQEVFFHLGTFDPDPGTGFSLPTACSVCPPEGCTWAEAPPPPILGELVEVEVDLGLQRGDGRAPRANRVRRMTQPTTLQGEVETFDPMRGYGFILGKDGVSYHLHKSEVLDGKMPFASQLVSFFAGVRKGRPRACHIKVCR